MASRSNDSGARSAAAASSAKVVFGGAHQRCGLPQVERLAFTAHHSAERLAAH
jgi:hypothetical protein